MDWAWIPPHLAIAWHKRLIEHFGGAPGIRDAGLLASALDRPRNLAAYKEDANLFELSALYGVAVAKAHAFTDGNKRIAFAVMLAFLKAHGQVLDTTEAEAARVMLAVAASGMGEDELCQWLVTNSHTE